MLLTSPLTKMEDNGSMLIQCHGEKLWLVPLKHVGGDEHDFRKSHVEVRANIGVLMQTVTLPEGNLPFLVLCS